MSPLFNKPNKNIKKKKVYLIETIDYNSDSSSPNESSKVRLNSHESNSSNEEIIYKIKKKPNAININISIFFCKTINLKFLFNTLSSLKEIIKQFSSSKKINKESEIKENNLERTINLNNCLHNECKKAMDHHKSNH